MHFKIINRPSKDNHLADTLSQKNKDLKTQKALKEALKTAILIKLEKIVNTIKISLKALEVRPYRFELVDLIIAANKDPVLTAAQRRLVEEKKEGWATTLQGFVLYHRKLFVPDTDNHLQTLLIEEFHVWLVIAHLGRKKTTELI